MKNITGSPVEGDNFFNREKELAFAWQHIQKGNSLVLTSPRRVGKTSFGKKLLSIAEKDKWNILEIDLEEITSEEAFIRLFIDKLENRNWWQMLKTKSSQKIEKLLSSIKATLEYEGVKGTLEWQREKENIYDKLKQLIDHSEHTLIMIDEVTILLNSYLKDGENGMDKVAYFLNWLRSFRQVSNTKIHWIFSSSIGLDNFTNFHNLSYTLNDITPYPLGAFDEKTSARFLRKLATSDKLETSDEIIDYMLAKLGWLLPYFIQVLHYKINYLVQVESFPLAEKTVDKAYQLLLEENYLNTWDERLHEYKMEEQHTRLVLKQLCRNPKGESRSNVMAALYAKLKDPDQAETLTAKLLKMLINDGYLIEEKGKYLFRSPLLRDFWFSRFVK